MTDPRTDRRKWRNLRVYGTITNANNEQMEHIYCITAPAVCLTAAADNPEDGTVKKRKARLRA